MRVVTFQELKLRKHQRETYEIDENYLYYGSAFFWFYSIIHLSGFDCSVKSAGRSCTIDTEIILALQLVRFTIDNNPYIVVGGFPIKKPSYKKLIITRGLIFDEKSEWNKKLKRMLNGTGYEEMLNKKPHSSYIDYFEENDNSVMENINFAKFLEHLPKDLFISCIAWILECYTTIDRLRQTPILRHSRAKIAGNFAWALRIFIEHPTKKELLIGKTSERSPEQRIEYYKGNREKLFRKLERTQSRRLMGYSRNTTPTCDKWYIAIETILNNTEPEE